MIINIITIVIALFIWRIIKDAIDYWYNEM